MSETKSAWSSDPKKTSISLISRADDPLLEELHDQTHLALDCEGVNLSRFGELCLLTLATENRAFLFDLVGNPSQALVDFLRSLLENKGIVKIVHDCRQDSDALYKHLSINIVNVFDTSVVDQLLRGEKRKPRNLNTVLQAYGCPINPHRFQIDYKRTPDYWRKRPLTSEKQQCAASDVFFLLELFHKQRAALVSNNVAEEEAERLSSANVQSLRNAHYVKCIDVPQQYRGRIIGKNGSTIGAMEIRFNCCIWNSPSGFNIFANNALQLKAVEAEIARLQETSRVYYDDDY